MIHTISSARQSISRSFPGKNSKFGPIGTGALRFLYGIDRLGGPATDASVAVRERPINTVIGLLVGGKGGSKGVVGVRTTSRPSRSKLPQRGAGFRGHIFPANGVSAVNKTV